MVSSFMGTCKWGKIMIGESLLQSHLFEFQHYNILDRNQNAFKAGTKGHEISKSMYEVVTLPQIETNY